MSWRNAYERYYCHDCERIFYKPLATEDGWDVGASVSPIVVCVDCGSMDTELLPMEEPDEKFY